MASSDEADHAAAEVSVEEKCAMSTDTNFINIASFADDGKRILTAAPVLGSGEDARPSAPDEASLKRPRRAHPKSILILLSGACKSADSLEGILRAQGFRVEAFDILISENFDLTDDQIWLPLKRRILEAEFVGLMISPPCGTFSRVRQLDGGPPPLRGISGASRYGLPGLDHRRAETVRIHNLLAIRSAEAMQCFIQIGGAFIFEQPAIREDEVSMLRMDEFVEILKQPGTKHTIAPQCMFGANAQKLSSWLTYNVDLEGMATACTHRIRTWYSEVDATPISSKHPPSRGTIRYYCTESQAKSAKRSAKDDYVTKSLANYPKLLNKFLALELTLAADKLCVNKSSAAPQEHRWNAFLGRKSVEFSYHLKGQKQEHDKDEADRQAIGGLRCAAESVKRMHKVSNIGRKIGITVVSRLTTNLEKHEKAGTPQKAWVNQVIDLIGKDQDNLRAPPDAVQAIKTILSKWVGHKPDRRPPVAHCTTQVDYALLESWRCKAGGPDDQVCQWLYAGAPAGQDTRAQPLFSLKYF